MAKNKISLKKILYNIKVLGKYEYIDELFSTIQMKSLLWQMKSRFNYNENISDLFQSVVKEFIVKNYKYSDEFTEEKFLVYLKNALPNRLSRKLVQWNCTSNAISLDSHQRRIEQTGAYSEDTEAFEEDFSEKAIDRIMLCDALKSLSERQSQVINMFYFQGYNEYEISDKLGISQQRVNSIKKTALKNLRKYLL